MQDSPYAWLRLAVALAAGTIGGVGMYAMPVALSSIQAEFGVDRAAATLPYTLTMVGFGLGGILMGRLADRFGVLVPVLLGGGCLGAGFIAAGFAPNLLSFAIAHGLLIGFLGSSATFAPLVADISLWFTRRRGIAVAICASGNYLAATVWAPVLQHFFEAAGWRATYIGVGVFALATIIPLALAMRRRAPLPALSAGARAKALHHRPLGLSPNGLTVLLGIAGIACCVAMAMPQVHIVAYCGDLGYGAARGAQMLAVMFGFGILSRIAWGWISDRIGGVRTLVLSSALQGVALAFFLPFDGLVPLFIVSALFGILQGGLVPAYAIIIREYFLPAQAGVRIALVLMATIFGMGLGGWAAGVIFDLTGSYRAAFVHAMGWNLLNLVLALWLLFRAALPGHPGIRGVLLPRRQAD